MTANMVNGSGNGARSGAQTLVLLGSPLNVPILRALAEGLKQQSKLRAETGSPAQSTLRAQLKKLVEIGATERHRRNRFPGVLEYELTRPGRDLLFVADVLEQWLAQAPAAPLSLEGTAAKSAVKALTEGWSSTIVRALSAGPLALTKLDNVIGTLSYPSLERRLAAMRLAGLVAAKSSNGRGTPYGVTAWLRRGIAPLAAAARWERRYQPDKTAAIAPLDAEATFLLTLPLVELPAGISGTCRLAVEVANAEEPNLSGVMVQLDNGSLVSCNTRLEGHPDAWAVGPASAWLAAVIEQDGESLELGGDCRLAKTLIDALHNSLFKPLHSS